MKKDALYVIEDFVAETDRDVRILKDHLSLLELEDDQHALAARTIAMLEKKIELMKKAKDKKDLKKVLKIKTLLGDRGQ